MSQRRPLQRRSSFVGVGEDREREEVPDDITEDTYLISTSQTVRRGYNYLLHKETTEVSPG